MLYIFISAYHMLGINGAPMKCCAHKEPSDWTSVCRVLDEPEDMDVKHLIYS